MTDLLRPDYWRVRLLLVAIIAAIVTPPDPFAMTLVMAPLFAIGEIALIFVRRRLFRPRI